MFSYRSLLDEPQFQQSLAEGDNELVPYFTQLRPAPVLPTQTRLRSAAGNQSPVEMSSVSSVTPAETYTGNCSTADRPKSECVQESLKEVQEEIKMKVQESIRRCAMTLERDNVVTNQMLPFKQLIFILSHSFLQVA